MKKYIILAVVLAIILLFAGVFLVYKNGPIYGKKASILCECQNHNGNYGQKGEQCGDSIEQSVGSKGYYGELKYKKNVYYYLDNCR